MGNDRQTRLTPAEIADSMGVVLLAPSEQSTSQNRIFYLDALRALACLCVIMIHASGSFVVKDYGSFDFWIGDLFDSVSRVGIPLFVMISGALMLDENYSYSPQKIKGHIVKMIGFFVFWSALYCVWNDVVQPLRHDTPVSLGQIVRDFITGPYHFWFIYLIIGLYLIVPLLRLWVKKENKRYIQYFLILSMIFCFIIPQIINIDKNYSGVFSEASESIGGFHLEYLAGYTMYYMLGWYLNTFEIRRRKLVYLLGALGLAATFFGTYILSVTAGRSSLMYDNLHITIAAQSAAVFVFFKEKLTGAEKNSRFISAVSKYSLGIYAVHIFILENLLLPILLRFNIDSAILQIPILFVLTLLLSLLVTAILSRIPYLKRFV